MTVSISGSSSQPNRPARAGGSPLTRRAVLRLGGYASAAGLLASAFDGVWATPAAALSPSGVPDLPTFTGAGAPPEPVALRLGGMMAAIGRADAARGAFWVDDMLARHGADPAAEHLLSRGRTALLRNHNTAVWGFAGDLSYIHDISGQSAYEIACDQSFTEDVTSRANRPSHYESVWTNGAVTVTHQKFITANNCAVAVLRFANSGLSERTFTLTVRSPYAGQAQGDELVGSQSVSGGLGTVTFRLSGRGLSPHDGALTGIVTVPAHGSAAATIALGMTTPDIPESTVDYDVYRGLPADEAVRRHVLAYNQWWSDAVPYIDLPDPYLKKLVYYRWWLLRFNSTDAELASYYQFPTCVEGSLGYDNPITNSMALHIEEAKWLRDPQLAYGTLLSAGSTAAGGAYQDNPGGPYWHLRYNQYISRAGWEAFQVHGGPARLLRLIAGYARDDVAGVLDIFDTNHDGLIEYSNPALTGLDNDAVSFFYTGNGMERTESAYVWWNATAAAAMWTALHDRRSAGAMQSTADTIRRALLDRLWDPSAAVFKHRDALTGELVPWKEVDNFYPFTVGLVPNTAAYRAAYRYWTEPGHYWIFPAYCSDYADYTAAVAAGKSPTLNFGGFAATAVLHLLTSTLRNYPGSGLTAHDYKRMLYWTAWLQFVRGDGGWPDCTEFLSGWNPATGQIDYRSFIHHDLLSNYNWTIVQDVAGLRPRADRIVELDPIDVGWDHFVVDQIRYHGRDLSITWLRPGASGPHGLVPGYSLYVDGQRVATVDRLTRLTWDSTTGRVVTTAHVSTSRRAPLPEAIGAALTGRVLEHLGKAGAGSGAWLRLSNAGSGLMLGVPGASLDDGAPVQQVTDDVSPGERWRLVDQGDGRVKLKNRGSDLVLAVRDDAHVEGADVVQSPDTGRAGEFWRVTDVGDGYVTLVNDNSHQVLTVRGDATSAGARIVQEHDRGAPSQRWRFLPDGPVKIQNSWSNKVLSAHMPNLVLQDAGVTADASYTSPYDVITGPINGTYGPTPRWTCWNSLHPTDWYAVTFSRPTTFDRVNLYFYNDSGGVQPPVSYTVQVLQDGQWVDTANQSHSPAVPVAGSNTVRFDEVTSTAVRVVLTNQNPVNFGVYTGLTAFEVFDTRAAQGSPATQEADTGTNDTRWTVTAAAAGTVKLVNGSSGLVLGVRDNATAPGAPLVQVADDGSATGQWRLRYAGGGYVALQNVASGLVAGVDGGALTAGAAVVQASGPAVPDHGSGQPAATLWSFVPPGP